MPIPYLFTAPELQLQSTEGVSAPGSGIPESPLPMLRPPIRIGKMHCQETSEIGFNMLEGHFDAWAAWGRIVAPISNKQSVTIRKLIMV
jgi:hypothetical protein